MAVQQLKTGDHVKSADGSVYSISYVHERDQTADLFPVDPSGQDYVNLPLAELKRVPKMKRAPIEGMPEERPACQYCGKLFKPDCDATYEGHYSRRRMIRRTFRRWRAYRDRFCTMGCSLEFAVAAHKAGYRIVRGK